MKLTLVLTRCSLWLRRLMIFGCGLSILSSSSCTLLPFHQLMSREVIMIQKGLIIGVLPMWIPENVGYANSTLAPVLFYDWIFRRQRIYTLKHYLDAQPVDLVLWTGLVSQADGGVESELELLSVDKRRPEAWQTLELTHSSPPEVDILSYRQFQVFVALMSRASENFLEDDRLPATLLWQQQVQRASHADSTQPPRVTKETKVYPYSSYAVAAGFIYNDEALLVVLVHMLSGSAYNLMSSRVVELINQYPDYCVERMIIVGYMPGDQNNFQLAQLSHHHDADQNETVALNSLVDMSDTDAHFRFLAPQDSQVSVVDPWLAEIVPKVAPMMLYADAVRIELTQLPSRCHPSSYDKP